MSNQKAFTSINHKRFCNGIIIIVNYNWMVLKLYLHMTDLINACMNSILMIINIYKYIKVSKTKKFCLEKRVGIY